MSMHSMIELTIDGRSVKVAEGTTLYEAASMLGVVIPVLCHDPRLEPVGVCRMCVVDIGQRTLAAACVRPCEQGMQVLTDSEEVRRHRGMLTRLLLSEQPEHHAKEATTGDDALLALAREQGIVTTGLPDGAAGEPRGRDDSSPVILVDHQACILCDRCVRGCDEIQHNDVITRTGKGYQTRIGFDLDVAMGESTCVSCGECVAVCPTGALTHRALSAVALADEPSNAGGR